MRVVALPHSRSVEEPPCQGQLENPSQRLIPLWIGIQVTVEFYISRSVEFLYGGAFTRKGWFGFELSLQDAAMCLFEFKNLRQRSCKCRFVEELPNVPVISQISYVSTPA